VTETVPSSLPGVGTYAPDFTLPSSDGRNVTLSAFRGETNVLLAFFPLAFTSTCTAELCAFTEDFSQFASASTVVVPISVDSTDTLREYKQKYYLKVELLSDFRRDVSRAYGVFNPAKFYANRAYVVVDRQGVVRWTWQEQHNGLRRQNTELLEVLGRLAA
jgi:peroxiredoxin